MMKIMMKWFVAVALVMMGSLGASAYTAVSGIVGPTWYDYRASSYAGGNGTKNSPYVINTPEQLALLAYTVNSATGGRAILTDQYFALGADIDLGRQVQVEGVMQTLNWVPIGLHFYVDEAWFGGTLIGNNHVIKGMTIKGEYVDDFRRVYNFGLFGCTYGCVEGVRMTGVRMSGTKCEAAGALVGEASTDGGLSYIKDCSVEDAEITFTDAQVGGIVGHALGCLVTHCTVKAKLQGARVGGVAGYYGGGIVTQQAQVMMDDCHAAVDIRAFMESVNNDQVGGLIGWCSFGEGMENKIIEFCSASGTIVSMSPTTIRGDFGGLIGAANRTNVEKCVTSVSIAGGENVGGLIGVTHVSGSVVSSFACGRLDVSEVSSAYRCVGGLVALLLGANVYLTSCTFAGTINMPETFDADKLNYGSIAGRAPSVSLTDNLNDLVVDKNLCGLPFINGYDNWNDNVQRKTTAELTSDDEPYNSLYMMPIDIMKGNETLHYDNGNFMLAAIPFYVKDAGHARYNAWQVTCEFLLVPLDYNRSTKTALAMYDVVRAPGGADVSSFLSVSEDTESAVKTVTPLDPGEADVIVTYYDRATKERLQRTVHIDVTYGIPWNNSEPVELPGGNGAVDDPYLIQNASQLLAVAADRAVYNRPDMYYRLANDIFINTNLIQTNETTKAGASRWTPVEWHANLDGNGKTIYGLYVNGYVRNTRIEKSGTGTNTETVTYYKEDNAAGLFSLLSGTVHDLAVVDSYLSISSISYASGYCGVLCGIMTGEAKIERCMVHGIIDSDYHCGGMVGRGMDIDFYESWLKSRDYANPVLTDCGTIEDCYGCVHVEHGLEYYHEHGTRKSSSTGSGGGIAGNGVRRMNRCVSTGKVENFLYRRGIGVLKDAGVSDVSTWYFDHQQMTTEKQSTADRGEHTTAEMTNGSIFAGNDAWQHEKGRYPILKQFAKTPYGDMLSMPVRFADGDRAGRVTKIFEFPMENVTWAAASGDSYVDVINECGGASPMHTGSDFIYARTDDAVSQCTKALRVMQIDVSVPEGTTVGIDFKDAHCKAAWLTAFDKGANDVVTLRNAVTVTESQAKAFNTAAKTLMVTAFPEMRFFTGIKILKPGMLSDLSELTELQLPRQLTDIGPEVFSGCNSLEEVTIPATTERVEPCVLDGSSIKDIYVDAKNTCLEVHDHALLTTDEELTLLAYPPARGEKTITLHGPFHNIATHAFNRIPQLDAIYIDYPKPEGSAVQMDDEAIVHYDYDANGELMDIYINDGSYDGHQENFHYDTGGNMDGILMKEYLEKWYWQEYADAGKLHRYFPLTVTAAHWATMYIGFCTQLPDGMKAYVVPDEVTPSSTAITLKRIKNKLHHTVPVVIYCETPGTYNLSPEAGMSPADDVPMTANKLQGTDIGQERTPGVQSYGLATNQTAIQDQYSILTLSLRGNAVGFYGFVGTTIPPYKAYLTCNWVGSNSRSLSVVIDDEIDEATGIASSQPSPEGKGEGWYDLGGRLITPPSGGNGGGLQPGLYIKNGKKMVISRHL
jgi:hypothetical protein